MIFFIKLILVHCASVFDLGMPQALDKQWGHCRWWHVDVHVVELGGCAYLTVVVEVVVVKIMCLNQLKMLLSWSYYECSAYTSFSQKPFHFKVCLIIIFCPSYCVDTNTIQFLFNINWFVIALYRQYSIDHQPLTL